MNPADKPPTVPRRKSIRLGAFNYAAQGFYFITLVTHERRCKFGVIAEGKLVPSKLGEIATQEWEASARTRSEITLGPFVLMPNHLHAIVEIGEPDSTDPVGKRTFSPLAKRSLSALVAGYKSAVTSRYRRAMGDTEFVGLAAELLRAHRA
jgi:putative transposase